MAVADLTERPGPLGYLTLQIDVKIFTIKPAVTAQACDLSVGEAKRGSRVQGQGSITSLDSALKKNPKLKVHSMSQGQVIVSAPYR